MLGASSTRVMIILLTASTLVVSCKRITPFDRVVLHRSAGQTLVVKNLTDDTIHVVPANAGVRNVEILPGDHWTVHFTVVTTASRDSGGTVIAGSAHNDLEPANVTRYFTLVGEDWVLTAGPRDDRWEHELLFGQCWFTGAAAPGFHHLEVAGPPIPGRPLEVCPRTP